ncbi:MAG: ABC transporter ATP-binding protein [Myxococcales bacterium]
MPAQSAPIAPADEGAAIRTVALTRRYGSVIAVDSLDLAVRSGEFFGLLGPNGAGKSTTIKMLTTLLPPTSGSASVVGLDVVSAPREVRRRLGYVPQMVSSDSALTGRENLLLFARLYGLPRAEQRPRAARALEFMNLSEVADRLVRTYSGGMIRRLEIAQSMLHRPPVLLLDEPTVGLDPVARHSVWDRLRDLSARLGTTVLLTTHDMEEAEALCGRIGLMHRGKLVALGTPAELAASVGPAARLEDVFVHFTGGTLEQGGNYRDAARIRETARRLQ